MRIAIVGAGAVGGYFGGRLAQAGEDVVFLARGEHLKALQTRGLRVDSSTGDFAIQHVRATDDARQVGEVDAVLLCVKAWQVAEVARVLHPLLGSETCVAPLQNGVEAPATLAAELGSEHVLGGLCSLIAFLVAPGHIRHVGGAPFIKFGELHNRRSERVAQLRRAFERAQGLTVEVPADIEAALWEKFLFIASWGGVGALTRAPIGIIRAQPGTRRILKQTMLEILEVARARKIGLSSDAPAAAMALLDEMPANGTASMQRDIMCGQPSELEAQTGAVMRLGREAGVETPINTLIYESLLPMEMRARGQLQF
ncbi:MAG: 2-dehydropantoate 2-reductase [Pseudomonadota bacterium]|nr:2-dehydropantoate 2-reductase [Pseudomonadota bacterium]